MEYYLLKERNYLKNYKGDEDKLNKLSDKRVFEIISLDDNFFKYYLDNFLNRLSSNKININLKDKIEMYPNNLLDISSKIKNTNNYRNFNFKDNNCFTPPHHELVFQKVYSLLDCYRLFWVDLDVLERESFLHVHLMRIYPFTSNNELIINLILASNLIDELMPPIVINKDNDYYSIIKNGDALKFKEYLINKQTIELEYMIELYKEYYLFPDNISIDEILIQKKHI